MITSVITLGCAVLFVLGAALLWLRARRVVTTPAERAVHVALHTASRAAAALRQGLTEEAAQQAAPFLRSLTGGVALAITDSACAVLTWDGAHTDGTADIVAACGRAITDERAVLTTMSSGDEYQERTVIAHPLATASNGIVGALGVVLLGKPAPGQLGAITDVVHYACGQLELAELDAARARLDRAEVRALRAQISPHFIYNALNTIASFVRTDPVRARELILEFADFTRYSFRTAGEFTVLADELGNIERYLTLEQARFGDALRVRLRIAPETLGVVLPFLTLQPLVENAVRHGLAGVAHGGTVSIVATDAGTDCVVSVEDDGIGMDPDLLRSGMLDAVGDSAAAHVGLANVDDRLRAAFGDDYGLVVETAPGAGMKVSLRVPKFRAGVQA